MQYNPSISSIKENRLDRVLVFQHVPHEGPGAFADAACREDVQMDILKLGESIQMPDLSLYSRLLIMGGPQSVYDTDRSSAFGPPHLYPSRDAEIETIKDFAQRGRPVLGVCLGAQLIAHALGGRVYQNIVDGKPYKEIGFTRVHLTEQGRLSPLFNGLPESLPVFQWHGDVFDLPGDAELLATGEQVDNQAFKLGQSVYGLLFHLEFTPKMVEELVAIDQEWMHKDNAVDERAVLEDS